MPYLLFQNNQVTPSTNEFDVYTFNETNVDILGTLPNQNNQRTQQSSYQVAYNWNDRNEDWEDDGNRQFDQLEFYCQAPGARPNPQFKWYIGQGRGQEIQGTDDFLKLSDPQNHRGSSIRQYGYRGMIQVRRHINNTIFIFTTCLQCNSNFKRMLFSGSQYSIFICMYLMFFQK